MSSSRPLLTSPVGFVPHLSSLLLLLLLHPLPLLPLGNCTHHTCTVWMHASLEPAPPLLTALAAFCNRGAQGRATKGCSYFTWSPDCWGKSMVGCCWLKTDGALASRRAAPDTSVSGASHGTFPPPSPPSPPSPAPPASTKYMCLGTQCRQVFPSNQSPHDLLSCSLQLDATLTTAVKRYSGGGEEEVVCVWVCWHVHLQLERIACC